jgi:lipid A ethanolaminephosphotransferase
MTQPAQREIEGSAESPVGGRLRLLLPAGVVLALLLSVSLFADPTIYHDARGDFRSWHLAFDLGYERILSRGVDPETVHDDDVYQLGLESLLNWRIGLVVTYILSLVSTLMLFVDRSAIVRVAAYASFLFFATTLYTYQQFDARFSPALAGLILSELGTFEQYVPVVVGTAFSFVVLVGLVLLAVRYLAGRFVPRIGTLYTVLAAALTLASTIWISFRTDGVITNASPLFKVPAAFVVHELLQSTREIPERQAVQFERSGPAEVANIVLLVDESVTGRYLQLNGYEIPNTPILASGSIDLFNFGDASSVYPFTEYSHQLLQSGVRIAQLPDYGRRIYAMPSIFQYAKGADFATAFIDGQYSSPKHTRNPIVQETDHVKFIDEYVSLVDEHGEADASTDYKVVDEILERLERNRAANNLVYAFKQGLHIPFELRYPPSERAFTPTLGDNEWATERPLESANSYSNGVLWSVDRLLHYLVDGLAERGIENTVVIYTSDHANRQYFGGVPRLTEYYSVPFLIFPVRIDDALRANLRAAARFNKDRISHVDIFPSILVLMGYDKTLVNRHYGQTIFDYMGARGRTVFAGDIFGMDGDHRLQLAAADEGEDPAGKAVDLSDVFGSASPAATAPE